MNVDPVTALHEHGLRVTKQRVAVIGALAAAPHSDADGVLRRVRQDMGQVSTQAVYDTLHALTDRGLVRRIQPAGSTARYELRVGDNHHHLVCRSCGSVTDVECAHGEAPCLRPPDLPLVAPGFRLDEAEVTYWGHCGACTGARTGARPTPQPDRTTKPTTRRNT